MAQNFVTAVILAAGLGKRMKSDITKQLILINGKTVLERSVSAFQKSSLVNEIIVVTRPEEMNIIKHALSSYDKVSKFVLGGNTRAESAKCGFLSLNSKCNFVAIHDGARCLISTADIDKVISDAIIHGAATASTRVFDSVKESDGEVIKFSHKRENIRLVQTPQVFDKTLYMKAIEFADLSDPDITDDNYLMEKIGVPVYCTETSASNIKITTVNDLAYVKYLLSQG